MNREEELYAAAVALPPGERPAFLARACGDDSSLRARLDALLLANDEADAFFTATGVNRPAEIPQEKPGDRIGRYKLLQKIGEGGCGVVYMAEQEEPVRRRVALKVIKLGMDTKAVIARFEAERQALALMDHPNIARVLDAGATETGRPYFVMELVRGIPITRHCDEENLSTDQRLQLFVQVCHAIQHAHAKGIIHRDIKPTNILVTMHDDLPVPKVIDFGIAKATQGRLTDRTVFTAFEQFMGTPAYMSPEQAQFNDLDVDARSDIYSLGVLLYELLTGQPPFDPKTLQQQGIDEIRRIIREVEPPRPSARLSTLGESDRATIAKLRGTAPAQLTTRVSGDLDWIVMRAMEKNRTRRYDSANSFAADIKRHLTHEPVVARPPSVGYRLQKFSTRHQVALAGAAAVVVALGVGLVLSQLFFQKADHGRTAQAQPVARQGTAADTVAIRKLPVTNVSWVTAVSPDERYLAYTPPDSSDTFLYEFASGKSTRLLTGTDTTVPWTLAFSSDHRQVAYDTSGKSLCVANLDGSGVKQLYQAEKNSYVSVIGWPRNDGQLLAVVENADTKLRTTVWFDANTGAMKPTAVPSTQYYGAELSANGDYVAQRKDGRTLSIVEVASGREEVILIEQLGRLIGWAHGDSELLFMSGRAGGNGLWSLAIKAGKPVGESRLVKEFPENVRVTNITRDGSIYYSEQKNTANVFLATANFENGELIAEPRLVSERFPGVQTEPVWSKDGRKLWLAIQGEQRRLVSLVLAAGKPEEFSVASSFKSPFRQFSWSQDGTFVLLQSSKVDGRTGIFRYEPATGKVETVLAKQSREWICYPRLTSDEKSFYFVRRKFRAGNTAESSAIIRRELASGNESVVYEHDARISLSCSFEPSPDGTRLAIVGWVKSPSDDSPAVIKLLDLRSGAARELVRTLPNEGISSLAWTPDGKRIVYAKGSGGEKDGPPRVTLWSTAVDTVESVKMKIAEPGMAQIAIHPDGKRFAFRSGSLGDTVDVWVMAGLRPPKVDPSAPAKPTVIARNRRLAIPLGEIVKDDGAIFDKATGIGAATPAGWRVDRAERSTLGDVSEFKVSVRLVTPALPEGYLILSQHTSDDAKLIAANEVDAWLRKWKETTLVEMRRGMVTITDYQDSPNSTSHTIHGRPALKWNGAFRNNHKPWAEYATLIYTAKGPVFVRLLGPADRIEEFRPALERFVESVRLP